MVYIQELFSLKISSSDFLQSMNDCRYNFSVNVIGFGYSGLQVIGLVIYFITGKYLLQHRLRGFFNFSMDQVRLSSL